MAFSFFKSDEGWRSYASLSIRMHLKRKKKGFSLLLASSGGRMVSSGSLNDATILKAIQW